MGSPKRLLRRSALWEAVRKALSTLPGLGAETGGFREEGGESSSEAGKGPPHAALPRSLQPPAQVHQQAAEPQVAPGFLASPGEPPCGPEAGASGSALRARPASRPSRKTASKSINSLLKDKINY